jgi:hypothetical protein
MQFSRKHHGHWLEYQAPDIRMLEFNRQLTLAPYLMQRPSSTKLSASLVQLPDQSREPRILGVVSALHTEFGKHTASFAFPVHHDLAKRGIGEVMPDNVARTRWVSVPVNQTGLGSVPRQHVPSAIANVGRRGFNCGQYITKVRSYHFVRFR